MIPDMTNLFPQIDDTSSIWDRIVPIMVMWESSQWLAKNTVCSTFKKQLHQSMDRCPSHKDINSVENSVKHHTISQPITKGKKIWLVVWV